MKEERLYLIASGTFGGAFFGACYGLTESIIIGIIGGVTCYFSIRKHIKNKNS